MAERVHPHNSPSLPTLPSKPSSPPSPNYLINIPNHHPDIPINRRNCHCCRCFLAFLFILLLILAIAALAFYLVLRPKPLHYSLDSIAITGLNLTSPETFMSPEFDFTVRANNPNNKIGIRYLKESSVDIFFKNVMLSNGVMPAFYQPSKNVTVFKTALKGNGINLCCCDRTKLVEAQNKLEVPLSIKVKVPVEVKLGTLQTPKITVTAQCHVAVDKLTPNPKILSSHCNFGVLISWVLKI